MAYTNPIEEDLRSGQMKRFYLLYGTEDYLKKQYREKLERYFLPEGDTMNRTVFSGTSFTKEALSDTADTVPFFAEKRVITVLSSGFFKNAQDGIVEILKDAPDTAVFLFIESEVDKRNRLYKFVKEKGAAVEFSEQSEELLIGWISGRMKKNGKQIAKPEIRMLISRVGTDMNQLDREMEKLLSYTLGRVEVTKADIEAVTSRMAEDRVFEMIDAMSAHDQKKAFALYYDALRLKEAPLRILALIGRQYRILFVIKDMSEKKMDRSAIASAAGVPPFAVNKYRKITDKMPMSEIRRSLEACAQLEEDVKTGRLLDRLSVELFLTGYGRTDT